MSGVSMFDITGIREGATPTKMFSDEWPEDKFYEYLFNMFMKYSQPPYKLEVVAENFIITVNSGKVGAGPWSLKYIGAMEYLCKIHGFDFTLQQPSQRMLASDEMIESMGFVNDQLKGAGHAYDSIRHAVVFMLMKYRWRPEDILLDG